MKEVWRKIQIHFLRHELWVAKSVLKTSAPLLSIIYPMTLTVWFLIPLFVLTSPLILVSLPEATLDFGEMDWSSQALLFLNLGILFALGMLVTLAMLLRGLPWFFICVALIFGSETLAREKFTETRAKLKALSDA